MKLPFVSRERYDEARERITALEAEREDLIDRILVLSGQKPLFAEVPVEQEVQVPATPDLSDFQTLPPRRPTLRQVQGIANKKARESADKGRSILTELKEAEMKGRRDSIATAN